MIASGTPVTGSISRIIPMIEGIPIPTFAGKPPTIFTPATLSCPMYVGIELMDDPKWGHIPDSPRSKLSLGSMTIVPSACPA